MKGINAVNFQTDSDDKREKISLETGIDFTGEDAKSVTRQEQGPDTDINAMLARFNVGAPTRPAQFGTQDFTIDLQQAMHALQEARIMYDRVPEGLKKRYPTWQALLAALDSGELTLDMTPAEPEGEQLESPNQDTRTVNRKVRRDMQLRNDDTGDGQEERTTGSERSRREATPTATKRNS